MVLLPKFCFRLVTISCRFRLLRLPEMFATTELSRQRIFVVDWKSGSAGTPSSKSASSNPAPFAAPPKQGRRGGSRRSAKSASSYDEMSINSGRPVIVNKEWSIDLR